MRTRGVLLATIGIIVMLLLLYGCLTSEVQVVAGMGTDTNYIRTYRDIPEITEEEIEVIENLHKTRHYIVYGYMESTEAFRDSEGNMSGFIVELCKYLTQIFEIEFRPQEYKWDDLVNKLNSREIDFTGELTKTDERLKQYKMTHAIAERSLRIFTCKGTEPIKRESDLNGLKIGFLEGSITAQSILELYPLDFEIVPIDNYDTAVELLHNGEMDAFVDEAVADPVFSMYPHLQSKKFFNIIYSPVSMTTANPDLEAIITSMDKLLVNGGIDKLYEMYKEGEELYAKYKLKSSFTSEELAYIANSKDSNKPIKIAFETDNYPVSFYNREEREFQGIAVDTIKEICKLTGLQFKITTNKNYTWAEVLDSLSSGKSDMVTQLLYSKEREGLFIWSAQPYTSSKYVLLSKSSYPNIAAYQILRARVGVEEQTAYEHMYEQWFKDATNLKKYTSQNGAISALQRGEIDLLMASDHMLLNISNYMETTGYKVNVEFSTPMESYFGFGCDQQILKSIFDKSQEYVNTEGISSEWTSKTFDYSKKASSERVQFMLIFSIILVGLSIFCMILLIKNKIFSKNLEGLVESRTNQLKEKTEAAQVAAEAKGEFLARMSHEIRTPLNAIMGMSALAKNNVEDPSEVTKHIEQITMASNHLLGILNDILDMSKIESGKVEIKKKEFRVSDAFGEVSVIITQKCDDKNIIFEGDVSQVKDIILLGDKLRINQVLVNLLGNAVKFTHNGGKVKLTVTKVEEDDIGIVLRFKVIDNGIGMTQEQIDKLFTPFEQTDGSIAARFGGTGLGLSISQNLINLMGGKIKVQSTPGNGSTFSFELWFEKGSHDENGYNIDWDNTDMTGVRILNVEDIEINRYILRAMLEEKGIIVEEATNGEEAVELFRRNPVGHYDLILMDVQMPIMDGYKATKIIRKLQKEDSTTIPIIAVTANAYSDDIDTALRAGMNSHLSKPIDMEELAKTIVMNLKN